MIEKRSSRGALQGLTAAALFGLSAPLSKALLKDVSPQVLAGLVYLGAAAALSIIIGMRRQTTEAHLRRADAPTLAAVTLAGGLIAPLAMLVGLRRTSAVTGSLVLNLEAPFTILLALVVFGEHLDRRSKMAAALIIGAGAMLGFGPGTVRADTIGVACLAVACLLWAIDNNLTQRLSGRDPFVLVQAKTLVAGTINLAIGVAVGGALPPARIMAGALALGGASYGASIVLDAYALRIAGAARESAYFATGPFFGAIAAIPILGDAVARNQFVAFVVMTAGVALLLAAKHAHRHTHTAEVHDHRHRHDDRHHAHAHDVLPEGGWHSHSHTHEPSTHTHPHDSDLHHRHEHP